MRRGSARICSGLSSGGAAVDGFAVSYLNTASADSKIGGNEAFPGQKLGIDRKKQAVFLLMALFIRGRRRF